MICGSILDLIKMRMIMRANKNTYIIYLSIDATHQAIQILKRIFHAWAYIFRLVIGRVQCTYMHENTRTMKIQSDYLIFNLDQFQMGLWLRAAVATAAATIATATARCCNMFHYLNHMRSQINIHNIQTIPRKIHNFE